jgi:hypothetical protein
MFKVEYFVQRDGIGLPLFTELPRRVLLGNSAFGVWSAQKHSHQRRRSRNSFDHLEYG